MLELVNNFPLITGSTSCVQQTSCSTTFTSSLSDPPSERSSFSFRPQTTPPILSLMLQVTWVLLGYVKPSWVEPNYCVKLKPSCKLLLGCIVGPLYFRTSFGLQKVSSIKRCPYFKCWFIHIYSQASVHYIEDVLTSEVSTVRSSTVVIVTLDSGHGHLCMTYTHCRIAHFDRLNLTKHFKESVGGTHGRSEQACPDYPRPHPSQDQRGGRAGEKAYKLNGEQSEPSGDRHVEFSCLSVVDRQSICSFSFDGSYPLYLPQTYSAYS